MAKRGALSKVEKYYIEGNKDQPVEQIAEDLDRSVNAVQKHINTLPAPTSTKKPVKKDKKETAFMQAVGRHERAGEKVATVMTHSASKLADESRPDRIASKKIQEAIHKPRG